MWFTTKEGQTVFTIKHRGHFYQLNNDPPNEGDYCLVDLEHDPTHIIRVKTFEHEANYPLNKDYRYGGNPLLRNSEVDFYGVCKIVWSDNLSLDINYQSDRREQFEYWSKQQPHLTLRDF